MSFDRCNCSTPCDCQDPREQPGATVSDLDTDPDYEEHLRREYEKGQAALNRRVVVIDLVDDDITY